MNGLVWLPYFKHLRILQPVESLVGGPFRTGLYGSFYLGGAVKLALFPRQGLD